MKTGSEEVGVCTIVTKSYLPFARTLMASVRQHHPEARRFVLLADRPQGYLEPAEEDFTVTLSSELKILKNDLVHFKYTVLELCTAVKPYYLDYLLSTHKLSKVLYLDPDILVTDALTPILAALDTHAVALTPHLTGPLDDELKPNEREIMSAGIYNLGFIGLRDGQVARSLLRWWQQRLYNDCIVAPAQQLFTDQRWIDLAPGLFQPTAILDDPGLNVAYWNLPHRQVRRSGKRYLVNDVPLRFFHFSGFDPKRETEFSKHQNRYTMANLGALRPLVQRYRQLLLDNGYERCRSWPYAYGHFSDGSAVPDIARRLVRDHPEVQDVLTGAFSPETDAQIIDFLNQPAPQVSAGEILISRVAYGVYTWRPDLQRAFPDIAERDRFNFAFWFVHHGAQEMALGQQFVNPITGSLHTYITPDILRVATRDESPHFNRLLLRLLNEPLGGASAVPVITAAAYALHDLDPDGARQMPTPLESDRSAYAAWFVAHASTHYQLPDSLIDPVRRGLANRPVADEPLTTSANLYTDLHRSVGGAALLGWLNSPLTRSQRGSQPTLSQFAMGLWRLEPDLRRRFDRSTAAGWAAFRTWFVEHAGREYDVPHALVAPVRLWAELDDFRERLSIADRTVLLFFDAPVDGAAKQPLINLAAFALYQSRPDLIKAYPDPLGTHRTALANWFVRSGVHEHDVPSVLAASMAASLGHQLSQAKVWTADIIAGLQRTAGGRSLISWANRDYDPTSTSPVRVTRFAYFLHSHDPQAKKDMPDPLGADNQQFGHWFVTTAATQFQVPAVLLDPVRIGLNTQSPVAPATDTHVRFRTPWSRPTNGRVPDVATEGNGYFREWDIADRAGAAGRSSIVLPPLAAEAPPAINLIGYLRAPTGVGEAARRMRASAAEAGIRVAAYSIEPPDRAGEGRDDPIANAHPITLLQVNADMVVPTVRNLGPAFMRDRYTIGYWYWELNDFPDELEPAFACVDEVWTATGFVQDAIARKSPMPVVRIPPSIEPEVAPGVQRSRFGLPERRFLFLMMFDASSVFERKNPLAVVEAFRAAFQPDFDDVGLVLKVSRGAEIPEEMTRLRVAIGELPVWILEERYEQPVVNALTQCCDCTVSLHRSEGLGLTLAEAMYLGKPTIATAYSGNTDFMHATNSLLVSYDLVPIHTTVGPYKRGLLWAEPKVSHAAEQMRAIVRDDTLRQQIAQRGQSYVQQQYSTHATGAAMLARLQRIHAHHAPVPHLPAGSRSL